MGGVSSVYIRPTAPNPPSNARENELSTDCEAANDSSELVEWHLTDTNPVDVLEGGVLELRLPMQEGREEELGRTIQFLAEENVKLRNKNLLLKAKLKENKDCELVQPDIYDETPEQKIQRLEKTLALERKEKWSAIEKSENLRVALVNCEQELRVEKDKAVHAEQAESNDLIGEQRRRVDGLNKESENLSDKVAQLTVGIQEMERLNEEAVAAINEENYGERGEMTEIPNGTDLETFRKKILEFRETRQRLIFNKSKEMCQLREDLRSEKALRERLEIELHALRNGEPSQRIESSTSIMGDISETNELRKENSQLFDQVQQLNFKISNLSATVTQLQNDLLIAKRKQERMERDKEEMQQEKEKSELKVQEAKEEQKRIWEEYDKEKEEIRRRTAALKEVVHISRQMLLVREKQVADLKVKLKDIEEAIAERTTLKEEYQKQLENIKALKELYEERVRLLEAERDKLNEKIANDALENDKVKEELADLKIKYEMACEEADTERQRGKELASELASVSTQARCSQRELSAMNGLITQMLLGPRPSDLDALAESLQQNHALMAQISSCDDCSDVAAQLPKLLLDLIAQVEEQEAQESQKIAEVLGPMPLHVPDPMTDSTDTISEQSEGLPVVSYKNATIFKGQRPAPKPATIAEDINPEPIETPPSTLNPAVREIVTNLPKVWKILTELLSHHSTDSEADTKTERTCYKRVETPEGPRSVISVSDTFIKLKELILEKKSLTREVCRLKHLNTHLETRLDDQEKRLSTVQSELHKTWGVVGRMRAQHQQLHNHEKILRYELQEKRIMLSELKQELQYCRETWERARRKNFESETECKLLRKEFALRKVKDRMRDSGESGYSDEPNESAEEADRSSTPSPVEFLNGAGTCTKSVTEESTIESTLCSDLQEEINTIVEVENIVQPDLADAEPILVVPELEESTVTPEEVSPEERERQREARALRLQRLEEECQLLVRKVDITSHKSNYLSNRLEELHDYYGGPSGSGAETETQASSNLSVVEQGYSSSRIPTPPPLPDTLGERMCVRDARIKRIKEACNNLQSKVSSAVDKSNQTGSKAKEAAAQEVKTSCLAVSESEVEEFAGVLMQETDNFLFDQKLSSATSLPEEPKITASTTEALRTTETPIKQEHEDENLIKGSEIESPNDTANSIDTRAERTKIKDIENMPPTPPPLPMPSVSTTLEILDARMAAREARMRRLEEDTFRLHKKTAKTVQTSEALSVRLEEVHEKNLAVERTQNGLATLPVSEIAEAAAGFSSNAGKDSMGFVKEAPIVSEEDSTRVEPPLPPPMPPVIRDTSIDTLDARMAAREARMRRLEEEAARLHKKTTKTVQRSEALSIRLDEVHKENMAMERNQNSLAVHSESSTMPLEISGANSKGMGIVEEADVDTVRNPASCEGDSSEVQPPEVPPPPVVRDTSIQTLDARMAAREARMRRLEEEARKLNERSIKTAEKSEVLSNRLDEVHKENLAIEGRQKGTLPPEGETEIRAVGAASKEAKTEGTDANLEGLKDVEEPIKMSLSQSQLPKNEETHTAIPGGGETVGNNGENVAVSTVAKNGNESMNETCSILKEGTEVTKPITTTSSVTLQESRMKLLEEEAKLLCSKIAQTVESSDNLSNRLLELKEQFGESSDDGSCHTDKIANPLDDNVKNVANNDDVPSSSGNFGILKKEKAGKQSE